MEKPETSGALAKKNPLNIGHPNVYIYMVSNSWACMRLHFRM